jgi:uncharacterized membrane protein (Fun14 family)
VNEFLQKVTDSLTQWVGDGPWRSKSVLAALLAVGLGLGFWCSDLKRNPSPRGAETAITNAPGVVPAGLVGAPVSPRSNWAKPFPFYVRLGVSYVAGYCIGWFFRRLTRLIMVVFALVIALLAYGKLAGCDMTRAQEEAKRGGEWAQHETTTLETYLKRMLPSATAGGVGTVLGFRRRSQSVPRETGKP